MDYKNHFAFSYHKWHTCGHDSEKRSSIFLEFEINIFEWFYFFSDLNHKKSALVFSEFKLDVNSTSKVEFFKIWL